MNKKVLKIIWILIVFTCFLLSCKTTSRFSGTTQLTVFVIDENDSPVNNFDILLESGAVYEPAVTNQNGLCVFYNMTSAEYTVSSKNPGYIDSKTKLSFTNKNDVFCVKVYSYDYVFNQAEILYQKESYQAAINLLKKLNVGNNKNLQNAKSFYLAYGYASLKQKKETISELKKIKAEPPFDDSAQKYKSAIQRMLE